MKVLIATEKPFAAVAVEGMRSELESAGLTVELLERYTDRATLLDAVKTADALIVRSDKVDGELLAAAPLLKLVVRAGAGYDNIDTAVAKARGVVVENTPGQNSNAVAELVFGMLLYTLRHRFDGTTGTELRGKELGLQAFGQVGRCVARIAHGMDMAVSAFDPYCSDADMLHCGVTPVHSVEELYSRCQVVSIHIPATPQTRGSIGFDLISRMPRGGVLVNTARKEVVDEEGLAKALRLRPDLTYIADVRPDCADALLAEMPSQVLFTPKKMGAQTAEANINAGLAAARQTVAFLRDGVANFRVNP